MANKNTYAHVAGFTTLSIPGVTVPSLGNSTVIPMAAVTSEKGNKRHQAEVDGRSMFPVLVNGRRALLSMSVWFVDEATEIPPQRAVQPQQTAPAVIVTPTATVLPPAQHEAPTAANGAMPNPEQLALLYPHLKGNGHKHPGLCTICTNIRQSAWRKHTPTADEMSASYRRDHPTAAVVETPTVQAVAPTQPISMADVKAVIQQQQAALAAMLNQLG